MKEIKIDQIVDRLLFLVICCNLSPEEMRERKKEVEALLPWSGTTMGWNIMLENDPNLEGFPTAPEPCDTIEGNWHYTVMC